MAIALQSRQAVDHDEAAAIEDLETRLLLDAVHARYGFDFREYASASIRRRLHRRRMEEGLDTFSALQDRLLHEPECMDRLLLDLSIHVTTMFRNPEFHRTFREQVVPVLRTYPFVRIWITGCASGEEVYSTAILLREEELYERSRIYATDMSDTAVRRSKAGIFDADLMKDYETNYIEAGGKGTLADYYTIRQGNAVMRADLKSHIVFSRHNLAMEGPFNEFNLILCRNVIIYFNPALRARVLRLFRDSLCRFGILGLGSRESLHSSGTGIETDFEELEGSQRLYRRIR